MALQRCLFTVTGKYVVQRGLVCSTIKQTFCELRAKYSSETSTAVSRKYSDRHEWVVVHKGTATIGISNYAQESLGDVVFAQLPDVGTHLKAGAECGALESVKAASDIYSPLTGTIEEKNVELEKKPALINKSCYDKGWLFKLKLSDLEELDSLMNEEEYETFLKTDVEKESEK